MENQEPLETGTVVGKLSDSIQTDVDKFPSDSVMSSGENVGGVLLPWNQLLWMEELPIGASTNFIDNGRLKVEEDGSGDILSSTCFWEESVKSIIATLNRLIGWHLTVRLNTVLETEQLPASVTNLNATLPNMY